MTKCTADHVIPADAAFCPTCGAPSRDRRTDEQRRRDQRFRKIFFGVAGVLVVGLIGWAIVFGEDSDVTGSSRPSSGYVTYEVTGSAPYATVTMETPTGTSQAEVNVPMRTEGGRNPVRVGPFRRGDFVYVSAQNGGESGSITCRITRSDGHVISENTSSGGFVIATCEGHF